MLQGLKVDEAHRLPRLEYLLAVILAEKRNYTAAAEHMRTYLRLDPKAADVAEVQKRLADLDKELASASVPTGPVKK